MFPVIGLEIVYGILASVASEGSTGEGSESVGVSDNNRKYYSLERAKEVLGYEPMDNSAEWDGAEKGGWPAQIVGRVRATPMFDSVNFEQRVAGVDNAGEPIVTDAEFRK